MGGRDEEFFFFLLGGGFVIEDCCFDWCLWMMDEMPEWMILLKQRMLLLFLPVDDVCLLGER